MKFRGKDYGITLTRGITYEEGKGLYLNTYFEKFRKTVKIYFDAPTADAAVAKAIEELEKEEKENGSV